MSLPDPHSVKVYGNREKQVDIMDTKTCLHILRNPYGWSNDSQRAARLFAADLIDWYGKSISPEPK